VKCEDVRGFIEAEQISDDNKNRTFKDGVIFQTHEFKKKNIRTQ
jgi:hypothetical protein